MTWTMTRMVWVVFFFFLQMVLGVVTASDDREK